jgi:hypothetical protein
VRRKKQADEASPAVKQNFIDIVALAAAALWFVIMVLLSWHLNDISVLTGIERALIGSIIIYTTVFVAFHIIITAALKAEQKVHHRERLVRRPDVVAMEQSSVSEETVEEK